MWTDREAGRVARSMGRSIGLALSAAGLLMASGCKGTSTVGNTGSSVLPSSGGVQIQGNVSGPSGIIANNSAGVIANNSAGVIANNSAGYRVASVAQVPISNALVYLTTPDERLYGDQSGHVISTTTDANGNYHFASAPATDSVIVTVILANNRRMVGFVDTAATSSVSLNVDVGTTLTTEFLRKKARDAGVTMARFDVSQPTLQNLSTLSDGLLGSDLAIDPNTDLQINAIPSLLAKYVVAIGSTASSALSDAWKTELAGIYPGGQVPSGVLGTRPVAMAAIPYALPAGHAFVNLANDQSPGTGTGNLYLIWKSSSYGQIGFWTGSAFSPVVGGVTNSTFDPSEVTSGNLMLDAQAVAVDPHGVLYYYVWGDYATQSVSDPGYESALFRWDPTSGATPSRVPVNFDTYMPGGLDYGVYLSLPGRSSGSDNYPQIDGMCFDPSGDLYLADQWSNGVFELTASKLQTALAGTPVTATTFAGKDDDNTYGSYGAIGDGGPATSGYLNFPEAVTWYQNALYISDVENHRIRMVPTVSGTYFGQSMTAGDIYTVAGGGSGTPTGVFGAPADPYTTSAQEEGVSPTQAHLDYPQRVIFDARGDMYIADHDNDRIRIVTPQDLIFTVAGIGPVNGQTPFYGSSGEAKMMAIGQPDGIDLDRNGNVVFVTNTQAYRLYVAHGVQ